MRTSFHHQPEAQHPNFQLSTSWQADYPILWHQADMPQRELNVRFRSQADMARPPLAYRPVADDPLPTKAPSKSRSAVG
jgi:hypothetical protein